MTRWRKPWRDITHSPGRMLLVITAIAAGTFSLGMIVTAYSILERELARTYAVTRPPTAVFTVDRIDDATVASLPGVAAAEARGIIRGRVRVGGEWLPLLLFVVRDFDRQHVDIFFRDTGAWPPRVGEVLIERSCLQLLNAATGDTVTTRTTFGERPLRIAGTVHAPALAPGWMDHVVTGFVVWQPAEIVLLRTISDQPNSRIASDLQSRGIRVSRAENPPQRHPHADQMETFLFLIGAFGVLTFVLSVVLLVSLIYTLLIEQVRQIGIMKAIGGSTRQIASLYLAQTLMLTLIGAGVGIPFGYFAGRAYARFASTVLNAIVDSNAVPAWSIALQIGLLFVPAIAALAPIARASRISIHEAFSNGVTRVVHRRFALRWLPRTLALSLRTMLIKRGRLALTLLTLAIGGAGFIAAMNVSAAWSRTIAQDYDARKYNIEVVLARPYRIARLNAAVAGLVTRVEYWTEIGGHDLLILALPADSKFLELPLLEGRWLAPSDVTNVVINHSLARRGLHLGSIVTPVVNGRAVRWTVVGIAKELIAPPTIYASPRAIPPVDTARRMRIAASDDHAIERALTNRGIEVSGVGRLADRRKAFEDHLVIIKSALMFAASLVIGVGAIALMSMLMLTVLERTREIAILGAIGARPRTIAGHVVAEGLFVGALSWVIAIVAAIPFTILLDRMSGDIFIKTPLDFYTSPIAVATWLVLVLILGALSSFYPARRASRLSVKEALAYE